MNMLTRLLGRLKQAILSQKESHFRTVSKFSPEAKIENTQKWPEFSILLPTGDKRRYDSMNYSRINAYTNWNFSFGNLFTELEDRKHELHIKNFGLSFNTMEQVFLKVSDSDIARENERTAASGEVDSNSRDEANMNVSNIARRLFMQQGLIANNLISEKITNKHQNVFRREHQ